MLKPNESKDITMERIASYADTNEQNDDNSRSPTDYKNYEIITTSLTNNNISRNEEIV